MDTRLYQIILYLRKWCNYKGKAIKWIVENPKIGYNPLIRPNFKLGRHWFWSNFPVEKKSFKTKGNIKDLSKNQLCELHQIPISLIDELNIKQWNNHDPKRQILRNCVLHEIGKHILDALINSKIKQNTIQNYI